MKTIRLCFSIVVVAVLISAFASLKPPERQAVVQTSHVEAVQQPEKIEPVNVSSEPEKPPEPAKIEATQAIAPAAPECGPADPKRVYDILVSIGVPRVAALQQVGSWQHESGLDPCQKVGDNGVAWGLNSWHPGRRADMPEDLTAQVKWAVQVEMPRDCQSCYDEFMRADNVWSVRQAIQRSTRWGVEGKRWYMADTYSQQF